MSTTKLFTTYDLRPWTTLSDKQAFNANKYNKKKSWKDLSKGEKDLVLKVYVGMETPNDKHPSGSKFTEGFLKTEYYTNVFKFSIKTELLEKCPNPKEKQVEELFNNFNIAGFVHNEAGPALINMVADREEFYMNGKEVDPEMVKKMKHNSEFVSKFDRLINE